MEYLKFKKILLGITAMAFSLFLTSPALAHVSVKPAEVGMGERVNFVVSVPTEEDNPTTSVRLVIPAGLQNVRPNAKAGWNVEIKKIGESMKGPILNTGQKAPDPEIVTEVIWSGGNIPAEMRDEFIFSAQAPAEETTLIWKAYQTYSDGTVVAWENDPETVEEHSAGDHDDKNEPKPYSETKVINDLASNSMADSKEVVERDADSGNLPLMLSAAAVIISGLSLGMVLRKR